jgi:2-polyprenyl-6-methoxyphenol hydroxylase-like FAD-dependent oxidoreductase
MTRRGIDVDVRWGSAVVVGGSVAGLLAARVLADRFQHVTILERDRLPAEPALRKGTPQASHVHALLLGGRRVLESLYEGFTDDLVRHRAPLVSMTADVKAFRHDGWAPRFSSELAVLLASRQLVEWLLRIRTLEHPCIDLVAEASVEDLIVDGTGLRARGVTARLADEVHEFAADLVVDASGRGSAAPRWLTEHDFERPEETLVNGSWGYASRFLQMPRGWAPGFAMVGSVPPTSASGLTRGGVLAKQDGEDRWIVTLMGCAKDYPPRDDRGFAEFAESLPFPDLAEALGVAEPLTEITTSRSMVNCFRHYERLQAHPERLIVTGDAVAAFNPVHGQGMSVAAVAATLLADELDVHATGRDDLDGFAPRFQQRLAEYVKFPWSISAGYDYRIPGVEGAAQSAAQAQQAEYFKRVMELSRDDATMYIQVLETVQLARSPEWLAEPALQELVLSGPDRP